MDSYSTKTKGAGLFESIHPRTSFILGFVTAILVLGTLGFVVTASCMLTGGCKGLSTASGGSNAPTAAAPTAAAPTAAPLAGVPEVDEDDHIRGKENAKVTLIEYSDFECPFCSRFTPTVDQVLAEYPDDVRLVYRHFPLSFHPQAEPAALASECAAEQGKFWEMHDLLFENQARLSAALYDELAGDLGLDAGDFSDCMEEQRYVSRIRADLQEGSAAGVEGTPGSFVIDSDGNATPIQGALPYEAVKQIVDAAVNG